MRHPGDYEDNWGGDQLLDGLISLSPLYQDETNNLHAGVATHPGTFYGAPLDSQCVYLFSACVHAHVHMRPEVRACKPSLRRQ